MEAISNVANAATKAVFGGKDNYQEPVSGAQGDVAKGEPYDAGNLEPDEQKKVETRLSGDKEEQGDKKNPEDPSEEEVKLDGPGPRPLDEVAREHGGDAGRDKEEPASATNDTENKDEDPEDKGTGEKHVKTSGFAAEGGDFDATKPGAGREADRLLDQKGVNTDGTPKKDTATTNGTSSTPASPASTSKHGKAKPSLSQRIKAKLHRH